MMKWIRRIFTHGIALAVGFALGVYLLPILTAPKGPDAAVLEQASAGAEYNAELTRDLRGSDFLHWGEGNISLSPTKIVHSGKLAPGPDYILYLTKEFVEHEDEFTPLKQSSLALGGIKSFDGFILDLPEAVNLEDYNTVVIWCESFGEFITSAKYK